MKLSHRIVNGVLLVDLVGNLKVEQSGKLKSYIAAFTDDQIQKGMIINFQQVEQVDSSGIGVVMSSFKSFQNKDTKFSICSLKPSILKNFHSTFLDKIIKIYPDEETALSQY